MSLNLDLGDPELEQYSLKCQVILDWMDEHPEIDFDTSFVESVQLSIFDKEILTERQKLAIDRIITSFDIEAMLN